MEGSHESAPPVSASNRDDRESDSNQQKVKESVEKFNQLFKNENDDRPPVKAKPKVMNKERAKRRMEALLKGEEGGRGAGESVGGVGGVSGAERREAKGKKEEQTKSEQDEKRQVENKSNDRANPTEIVAVRIASRENSLKKKIPR